MAAMISMTCLKVCKLIIICRRDSTEHKSSLVLRIADDREAINACKGLRREATVFQDMRPVDGSRLEYSYRPLENINQFWAGPSYWKIRPKSRKVTMAGRPSFATSDASSSQSSAIVSTGKRKVALRSRNEAVKFVNTTTFVESNDENRCPDRDEDDDAFLSVDSKLAQKFKKHNVYKRWDSKRLKLPTDLHVDRELFSFYTYCPSAVIQNEPIENATPANDIDVYDSDHNDIVLRHDDDDNDDAMMDHDMDDGIAMDHINDVPEIDTNIPESPPISQIPESQLTQSEGEISQHYEGAPPEVN